MENMYEIFAREHPGLFTNCRDITALMEAAYGAWYRRGCIRSGINDVAVYDGLKQHIHF